MGRLSCQRVQDFLCKFRKVHDFLASPCPEVWLLRLSPSALNQRPTYCIWLGRRVPDLAYLWGGFQAKGYRTFCANSKRYTTFWRLHVWKCGSSGSLVVASIQDPHVQFRHPHNYPVPSGLQSLYLVPLRQKTKVSHPRAKGP